MSEAAIPKLEVLRLDDIRVDDVSQLLKRFGLSLRLIAQPQPIPGSYWGDDEAGLIGAELFARADTPLHSILHEACHWISCSPERRSTIHTDAADTQQEEDATCYLQIVLADYLRGFDRARALADMDAWGYSFRLGSAARWFDADAQAERTWLQQHGLLDANGTPTFRVRVASIGGNP